jgi:glycine cleavage system aminomethyltransferase T
MPDAWNPLRRSPLHARLHEAGAVFESESGWALARHFGDPDAEFQAGSTGVALSDLSWTGKWQAKGRDLDRDLGLSVSGEVPAPGRVAGTRTGCLCRLTPGEALFLCQDGRPEPHPASGESGDGCLHLLERTDGLALMALWGPDSRRVLAKLSSLDLRERTRPHGTCAAAPMAGVRVLLVRWDRGRVPAYQIVVSAEYGAYLWDTVLDAGREYGLRLCGLDSWTRLEG